MGVPPPFAQQTGFRNEEIAVRQPATRQTVDDAKCGVRPAFAGRQAVRGCSPAGDAAAPILHAELAPNFYEQKVLAPQSLFGFIETSKH